MEIINSNSSLIKNKLLNMSNIPVKYEDYTGSQFNLELKAKNMSIEVIWEELINLPKWYSNYQAFTGIEIIHKNPWEVGSIFRYTYKEWIKIEVTVLEVIASESHKKIVYKNNNLVFRSNSKALIIFGGSLSHNSMVTSSVISKKSSPRRISSSPSNWAAGPI